MRPLQNLSRKTGGLKKEMKCSEKKKKKKKEKTTNKLLHNLRGRQHRTPSTGRCAVRAAVWKQLGRAKHSREPMLGNHALGDSCVGKSLATNLDMLPPMPGDAVWQGKRAKGPLVPE